MRRYTWKQQSKGEGHAKLRPSTCQLPPPTLSATYFTCKILPPNINISISLCHSLIIRTKMASFTVPIITLALVLLASAAATTTAAVEIVNLVDDQSARECLQEIEGQRLSSCRNYLRDSSKFPVTMPRSEGGGRWREEFPRCCEELEQITQHCRCQAIAQVYTSWCIRWCTRCSNTGCCESLVYTQ